MLQLDQTVAQNQDLQKQLDAAQLSLMENREQRILDWNKFNVQEQDKMALELAKLQQSGEVDGAKIQLDAAKLMQTAEKEQIDAMNESDRILLEMRKQGNAEQRAYDKGEDQGYRQGVDDGVNASFGG